MPPELAHPSPHTLNRPIRARRPRTRRTRILCGRTSAPAVPLALLAAALLAPAPLPAQAPELRPLPATSLEDMEAPVAQRLVVSRQHLEEVAKDPDTTPRELATAYGELGRNAFAYVLLDLAEPAFANAEVLDPEDHRWPYLLGALYQQQRRLPEAAAALERALADKPGDLPALVRLGQVRLEAGEQQQARPRFEAALAARPGSAAALYGLGRIAADDGDYARAVERFEAALAAQPGVGEVEQQLGLAYRELGDMDAARRHLAAASPSKVRFGDPLVEALAAEFSRGHLFDGVQAAKAGRYDEAAAHYRKAVESDPTNASYRQALASALDHLGNLEGAAREYTEAVRLEPDRGIAHLRLAVVLERMDGITEEALGHYRKAVELAPELGEAHFLLASALAEMGQLEEAESHFSRTLELDPDNREARLRRSRMLLRMNRGEEAISDLKQVVAAEPEHAEAVLALGRAQAQMGQLEEARESLERALALDLPAAPQALAHFQLAQVLEAQGEAEEAIRHYRATIEGAPRFKQAHLSLAALLLQLGRAEEAAGVSDDVLALDPEDPAARLLKAQALAAGGEAAAAAEEVDRLAGDGAQSPLAAVGVAATRAQAGDLDGAIAGLEEALAATKSGEDRSLLLFNLGVLQQRKGDAPGAEERYRAAVAAAPGATAPRLALATLLGQTGRFTEAAQHFGQVVEIAPDEPQGHVGLATALALGGNLSLARSALETGHARLPDNHQIADALARLLATAPDPAVRDGAKAVELAQRVQETAPSLEHMETLGLALAAVGRFEEAARWQERLVNEARGQGLPEPLLQRLRTNLERYRAGEPPAQVKPE